MKKLLLILLCVPLIVCGQLTYVPDDVFEEYIEDNFPLADNGIPNDDYVLTAGLDLTSYGQLYLNGSLIISSIQDLTGIEDFFNGSVHIQNLNITTIDLSQLSLGTAYQALNISNCPLLTDIILPSDTFALSLATNTFLTNIVFHPYTVLSQITIYQCNSLTNIDISNILGVYNGSLLTIGSNLNLSQVNLKNGFCYNWGVAQFTSNPNLFCIEVDDPNYSSIASNWTWFEQLLNPILSYSTNCGWPSALQEQTTSKQLLKFTDLLGREVNEKRNTPLFYIYNDGTVEKKIIIE